jgi:hypothetical protein
MKLREYVERQIDGIFDAIILGFLKTDRIKLLKLSESTIRHTTYQMLMDSFTNNQMIIFPVCLNAWLLS